MTGTARDERLRAARAYLAAVAEPPAPALAGCVAEHGPVRVAELVHRGVAPAAVADEVEARREHVSGAGLLAATRSSGARLLVPEDPDWPAERFALLAGAAEVGVPGLAAPLALWVRGRAELGPALGSSVAVVGARAATGYGEHLAAELGHGLAASGVAVVSGAAYGIDGAAHRGALAAGGTTVAFLACGIDVDYPAGHGRLLRAIAAQGLVATEYAPGTTPRRHRFLVRNRLIAACGHGTVVVEAGARSGAGNTANTTDALGLPLMAVPGPVTSASSVGCHDMVRAGKAVLVTSTAQVLEMINPLGAAPPVDPVAADRPTDALEPRARRLHDAIVACNGADSGRLARECGLPVRTVRALLPELELAGLVERKEGGWIAAGG
ncbi:DNA-processing protein DprA [Saccharopolyspora gregorii]|uniref:DNA-processing protein DprA n=1 Tax=Saccharopolyspora gregorii TaxID=33914 RepID=UPI0021ACE452|nr:DNA-protecting protein DprA [Saccharopolyspora gregorii]